MRKHTQNTKKHIFHFYIFNCSTYCTEEQAMRDSSSRLPPVCMPRNAETELATGSFSLSPETCFKVKPCSLCTKPVFCSFENMTRLLINYWRETGDRYCPLFLPFSHLILVVSTSFSCSRHCCTTPPPPDRMWSLASQQIMWRTRVRAEDEAMSHKGPRRVLDYDNIRKCRKEEVSAGSWQACEGLSPHRESYWSSCEAWVSLRLTWCSWGDTGFFGVVISELHAVDCVATTRFPRVFWLFYSAHRCCCLAPCRCIVGGFVCWAKTWPFLINHWPKNGLSEDNINWASLSVLKLKKILSLKA